MEINLFVLIGIALGTMFFGYFFGLFEGRGQGYNKRKKEEPADRDLQLALQKPVPAAVPAPVAPKPPEPDNSLLRLSLDQGSQARLDLDGQRIETGQLTAAQRKRLIDLMLIMRPWVEGAPVAAPAAAATPIQTGPAPAPTPAASVADRMRAATAASRGPVVAAVAEAVAGANPSTRPLSLVAQIDAVLQTRIAGTPLADKGIRLVESPEGGVLVVVGLNRYPNVNEVPDPEAQTAIRAAIAEWEEKYTPI